jgi:O-antigen ligase
VERDVKDYFYFSLFIIAIFLSLVAIVESYNQFFAGLLADIFRDGNSVYINNRLRPSATLTHSNIFSCFMAISVFVALKLYFENKLPKIPLVCGIILFLIGLSLGGSRNALWTFLISLFIFAFSKKHLKIAALIFLTFLITYFAFTPSLKRISEIKTESSISRILLWKSSVKMFKDYPILGVGPGCFNKSLIKYAPEDLLHIENHFISNFALNAHNGFFNVLSEFGLSGIIILTIFAFYYLIFFIKLHPVPLNSPDLSLLFVISLPFLADAFFYSYFYMIVFCVILFLLLRRNS